MASLAGAITALGLAGVSIAAPVWDSEYATSPKPYTQTFTALSNNGTSGPYLTDYSGKTELTDVSLEVSDTASLSATEEPVDSQQIEVADIARLSVTETVSHFHFIAVTDTATLSASELVALSITGVTPKPVTDTASISATEVTSLSVSLSVTDTASLSATDTSSVAVSTESVDVTDTASLSADDASLLTVFTGQLELNVVDSASLRTTETASIQTFEALQPIRLIRFDITAPSIRFEFL
jgi:hypothetical protein